MKFSIEVQPTFAKEVKRLSKRYKSLYRDLQSLQSALLSNPCEGTDLGHGLRKVRMAISDKNKGKSHGARIITFTVFVDEQNGVINLLYIYDKEEHSSISKEEILEMIKSLEL